MITFSPAISLPLRQSGLISQEHHIPATIPDVLRAAGVHHQYGHAVLGRQKTVLRDVNWVVPEGRRTLLLGPNGAGKSTLLKLLAGVMRPRSGSITVDGDGDRSALFRRVGWMPQDIRPLRGLTVAEQVRYTAWLAGATHAQARNRAEGALEAVLLADHANQPSHQLSGGQLRRLGLAQTLVTQAWVTLLDEPTAGLDPAQTKNFREIVRGLGVGGGLVVSTHQVSGLDEDFDHVTVLSEGSISFDGSTQEFYRLGQALGSDSGSVEDIFSRLVQGGLH